MTRQNYGIHDTSIVESTHFLYITEEISLSEKTLTKKENKTEIVTVGRLVYTPL